MLAGCKKLETLHAANCGNVTGKCFLSQSADGSTLVMRTSLMDVDFSGCDKLSQSSVTWIVGGAGTNRITSLKLNGCYKIADSALFALADGAWSLTHLEIGGCFNITDKGIKALAGRCTLITYLELSKLSLLTNNGIMVVITQLRYLECLSISANHGLDSKSFMKLYKLFHAKKRVISLTALNVSNVMRLDDNALVSLAYMAPALSRLDLSWCRMITDRGLEVLAPKASQLSEICLNSCSGITDNGMPNYYLVTAYYPVLAVSLATTSSHALTITI